MKKVQGNLLGLKPSQRQRLERLFHRRLDPGQVIAPELARTLCELSREIGRQIGILVDRKGKLQDVIVGDARQIEISEMRRYRVGPSRFRGVRFVHTHLNGEPLSHDDLTDLALLRFDLIAAVEVLESGLPGKVFLAHLHPDRGEDEPPWRVEEPVSIHDLDLDVQSFVKGLEEEFSGVSPRGRQVADGYRRAILVGVSTGTREELESSMEELKDLAESANVRVVDTVLQRRNRLDPKFVVGSGKMKELYIQCMQKDVDLMIFDGELSGSQVRAISDFGELEVWDRTQLILDIFARRARSRGGKLQVELAMLKYSLPRLVMKDDFLSRLTGGIGARGPGETKMEVLRRRVRDRIARLEKELEQLSRERRIRRAQRNRSGVPVISIVGYTNAGKSTLLNTLTGSDILAEDRLFATLDPTSRRLRLPGGRYAIMTDTVGFIRELPEDLVEAFKATLEELHEADLLLHLVDASNPEFPDQILAVEHVLADLALDNLPIQVVFNKVDQVSPELRAQLEQDWGCPAVSALDRKSLEPLLVVLDQRLLSTPAGFDEESEFVEVAGA
ncbi:MAG: GTPase HflX [Armatimonadetes bacterium]|nr:GTPase HflX [Armatimonadota bacterium]